MKWAKGTGLYGWCRIVTRRPDIMSITKKLLRVDLTDGNTSVETIPDRFYELYLGGRGMGARILFDEVDQDTDPLSAGNVLIISAGALAGTFAPASARLTITSKSPETGIYCKSNVGGHWSPELKFAGYDAVVIKGKSEAPVYLSIRDDRVELVDAGHIWGRDIRETNRILKEGLGDNDTSVLAIGEAGENLVGYASIVSNVYRQAARGGMGCVMGSKKLKAIAVRGTNALEVANPSLFREVALRARDLSRDDLDRYYRYHFFGANRGLVGANEVGFNPTKNFQTSYLEGAYRTGGEYVRERYIVRENGCGSCVFCCGRSYEIEEGLYAGTHSEGPEWEAGNAFGARIGNTDTEFVLKANEFCNINGLDLSSAMSAISFAMECFEKGLLTEKDADGLRLEWGNTDAVLVLLKKIVKREGIGELLSLPINKAVRKIGNDSSRYAMQIKGLGLTSVDLRSSIPYALAFAVNPRGGDHLHTEIICQFGATPEHVQIANRISESEEGSNRFSFEGKAKLVKYHEEMVCASDCLGICFFHTLSSHRVTPKMHADMFSSATGIPMDEKKLLKTGERILNLERMFNIREGLTGKDDYIPQRFFEEEVPDGPAKGRVISKERFERLLEEYYEEHGWDSAGIPTKQTLRGLGL
jgi:aldehyde:ferredoxin oxidoreductase